MKNKILLIILCIATFISCSKEHSFTSNNLDSKVIVLQERDPNSPLILSKKRKSRGITRGLGEAISFDNCLGKTFKCGIYPLGSIEDVGFSTIDLNRFYNDYPSYFSKRKIGESNPRAFSYASFSTYTENSQVTKKVSGGISLNLGLFKIGAKTKMTEIFTSSRVEDSQTVFGELVIEIRDSSFTMQTSSNICNKIILDYLSPDFKDELYNTTPSELFHNYGGFILSGFVTGGRASALYSGTYVGKDEASYREKDMKTDISASYGFKMKDTVGNVAANAGFGKKFSNGTSSSSKITNLEVSIKTTGGDPLRSSFSVPQNINTLNVDISGWVNSLNDKSTLTMIEILDNGLLPLSDLMMEVNLKNTFSKFYNGERLSITRLQEPYIEILCVYNSLQGFLFTYLNTRFGDKVLQNLIKYDWDLPDFNLAREKVGQVAEEMKNKYKANCGLRTIFQGQYINSYIDDVSNIHPYKTNEYITLLHENNVQKFTHNDVIYLLFSFEGKKYAYSIHDDYILDTYAMRNYINNLPSVSINVNTIFTNYTIIAL